MKTLNKKRSSLIIGVVLGLIALVGLSSYIVALEPRQKTSEWQSFKSYTSTLRLTDINPIYSNDFTTGCFNNDAGYGHISTCTFSSKQFYTLQGNYKVHAQQILVNLRQQGFDFMSDSSKNLFESHINNKNIAGDLSNATPLASEFINNSRGIKVRLVIGDKKRLNPQGPTGLSPELFNNLSDQQLMTILEFSRVYK